MLLTTKHIANYRRAIGEASGLRSAERALEAYAADGVPVAEVPPGPEGGRPARGVDSAHLAAHVGVSEERLLRWINPEAGT